MVILLVIEIIDQFMNAQREEISRNRSKFGRFYKRYNDKSNKFTIQSVQSSTNNDSVTSTTDLNALDPDKIHSMDIFLPF